MAAGMTTYQDLFCSAQMPKIFAGTKIGFAGILVMDWRWDGMVGGDILQAYWSGNSEEPGLSLATFDYEWCVVAYSEVWYALLRSASCEYHEEQMNAELLMKDMSALSGKMSADSWAYDLTQKYTRVIFADHHTERGLQGNTHMRKE